jgi:Domain of Unknown Function (DUF1080)
MTVKRALIWVGGLGLVVVVALAALYQSDLNPAATEQWEPKPPIVAPVETDGAALLSALILFDGIRLDEWEASSGGPAGWKVADGVMTVDKASGNIQTKRRFSNFQLHIEWRVPKGITGSGQKRGNSGLFLASTGSGDAGYELQILDSYANDTYVNGQAGAVYKQYPPLANPARPPGEWQSYDVSWTAPRFAADGKLLTPARLTAFFNGVLIQNNVALRGETVFIGKPSYRAHGPSPIMLQAHRDPSAPISFRNIWVRELRSAGTVAGSTNIWEMKPAWMSSASSKNGWVLRRDWRNERVWTQELNAVSARSSPLFTRIPIR